MSIILFPFKLLAVPLQGIAGPLGLVIAGILNAWLAYQAFCWAAWRCGWSWVTGETLLIVMVVSFLVTLVVGKGK